MIIKDLFGNNEAYTREGWRYDNKSVAFSRMYYVLDGEAYYEENGNVTRLKKGHLYLTPAKTKYSLYENSDDKLLHRYVQIYTAPTIRTFVEAEVTEGTPLYEAVSLWGKYYNTSDKEFLINVLHLVLYCIDKQLVTEDRAASVIKRYIDGFDNAAAVDMQMISASLGYTREYITRTFTAAYNITPMQYFNSKKMEYAWQRLRDGTSIKETAYAIGYSTPYAFSKAFKKYYGLSPKNYFKSSK